MRRGVRIVAGSACAVLYGAVENGLFFPDQSLVTAEAEVLARLRQKLFRVARVRRMAGRAAPLCLNGRVDALCRLEPVFNPGMALVAQPGAFGCKELLFRGAVRVVAGGAAARKRGVHGLFLQLALRVHMTGEAQRCALGDETRVVRLVRMMAERAISRGYRAVDIAEVRLVGMAGNAGVFERARRKFQFL